MSLMLLLEPSVLLQQVLVTGSSFPVVLSFAVSMAQRAQAVSSAAHQVLIIDG